MDGSGRMWIASDAVGDVNVRYSDASTNYATWSAPIVVASGITDDDISAIVAIPTQGKIGVLWSNQNTQHFGFKTHNDGADPTSWSSDEAPNAASALNLGLGMADDHLSIVASSNGTLYCAVKTGYETDGYAKVALLVRRPAGTWDPMYAVTKNLVGTRPIVIVNETRSTLKVVYTSHENGGNILYKEASLSNFVFGKEFTLLSGMYNYSTSTHQLYNPDVVILATEQSDVANLKASGVYCSDAAGTSTQLITQKPIVKELLVDTGNDVFSIFPTQLKRGMQLHLKGIANGSSIFIADSYGRIVRSFKTTSATIIETNQLAAGIYFLISNEKNKFNKQKFIVTN
jgi:hypothetical protein